MLAKIKMLIHKHWDFILYCVFGVFTTIVNYAVYYPLLWWAESSPSFVALMARWTELLPFDIEPMGFVVAVINGFAWLVSVIFSFITNKIYVFKSKNWSWKVAWPEAWKFIGCRVGSFAVEEVFLLITVSLLHWDENWMKIVVSVIVILINYIGSKSLFSKNRKK